MKYELVYIKEYRILIEAENHFDALSQADRMKPIGYDFLDFNRVSDPDELIEVEQKIKTQPQP